MRNMIKRFIYDICKISHFELTLLLDAEQTEEFKDGRNCFPDRTEELSGQYQVVHTSNNSTAHKLIPIRK